MRRRPVGFLKRHPKHSRKRGVCWWRLLGQSALARANVARGEAFAPGRCDAGLAGGSACQPVGRRRSRSGRTNCGGRVGITGRSPHGHHRLLGATEGKKKVRYARGVAADPSLGIEHKWRRSGSAVGSSAHRLNGNSGGAANRAGQGIASRGHAHTPQAFIQDANASLPCFRKPAITPSRSV